MQSTQGNYYIKLGNLVLLQIYITRNSVTSAPSSPILFTLPAGYRPIKQINTVAWIYGYNSCGMLSINTSGEVRVRNNDGGYWGANANAADGYQFATSIIFSIK